MKLNEFVKKASNLLIVFISILTLIGCFNILIINGLIPFFNAERFNLIQIIGIFLVVIILVFLWMKWNKRLDNLTQKKVNRIIAIGFFLFFVLQIFYIINFKMEPGWDFGWLVHLARKAVHTIPWEEVDIFYMYSYQHNYPSLIAYLGVFKLFGENFNYIFVLGFGCIASSMCLIQLTLKKLFSPKMQLVGFILMIGFYPFLSYSLIAYSDVLALPFLCLAMYFIVDKNGFNLSVRSIIGFSISLSIGMLFKILCLIPLIALGIVLILKQNKKVVLLGFTVVCYFLLTLGFGAFVDKLQLTPISYKDSGVTPLYYINLGLNQQNYGGYNEDDYNYYVSLGYALTKEEREEVSKIYLDSIIDRLSVSINDLFHHYQNKIYKSWTDGQMQMQEYILVRSLSSENGIYQFFTTGIGKTVLEFTTQIWYILLISMMTIYYYLNRKKQDDWFIFLELVFLGMFFYLLLFEAGSRYTWIFVPFMLFAAVQGLQQIGDRLNKNENYNKIDGAR